MFPGQCAGTRSPLRADHPRKGEALAREGAGAETQGERVAGTPAGSARLLLSTTGRWRHRRPLRAVAGTAEERLVAGCPCSSAVDLMRRDWARDSSKWAGGPDRYSRILRTNSCTTARTDSPNAINCRASLAASSYQHYPSCRWKNRVVPAAPPRAVADYRSLRRARSGGTMSRHTLPPYRARP
jgi:hypothetical protein